MDISSGVSTFQDPKIWKDLVSLLNARIGFNSHIDLYWKAGDPLLRLVIFGSNLEEQAGEYLAVLIAKHPTQSDFLFVGLLATVKLVLRHLPEAAKLVLDDDPNELQNTKALLLALQNEADSIKRHHSLSPQELTIIAHTEMAALQ